MADIARRNSIIIIGTLKNVVSNIRNSAANGSEYIIVNAEINSVIGGETKTFDVRFMANKLTQAKAVNKLFEQLTGMQDFIGRKIEVRGSLSVNRFWSTNSAQIANAQTLAGRFWNVVSDDTEDKAEFTIEGCLLTSLTEKKNKEGAIYRYDLEIGQPNYHGDMMEIYTLHVDPNNIAVLNGIRQTYKLGQTASFSGILDFTTRVSTIEDKNTAFGQPVQRQFTNRIKNFYITSGSLPYTAEQGAYSSEQISGWVAAYKARDIDIASKAQDVFSEAAKESSVVADINTISNRQASLI